MTRSEEYRELLIKEWKATGDDYIIKENAENIVSKLDYCRDFDLSLSFPSFDEKGSLPTIGIHQVCFNDATITVRHKDQENKYQRTFKESLENTISKLE